VSPTLPAATFRPDTYPSWLLGRLYAIRDPATHDPSLARVGMPGRVPLEPGSFVLGSFGARVITSQPGKGGTRIQILSFDAGGEIAAVTVTGSASGSPFADGIVMDNREVIGTDGSIRHLRDPGPGIEEPGPLARALGLRGWD
jgi:hypothetical protein